MSNPLVYRAVVLLLAFGIGWLVAMQTTPRAVATATKNPLDDLNWAATECLADQTYSEKYTKCIPECQTAATGNIYSPVTDRCEDMCKPDQGERWSTVQQKCVACDGDRLQWNEGVQGCVCQFPQFEPKNPTGSGALTVVKDNNECQVICQAHEKRDPTNPDVACICEDGWDRDDTGQCKPVTTALQCAGVAGGIEELLSTGGRIMETPTKFNPMKPTECGPKIPITETNGTELALWCADVSEGKLPQAQKDQFGRLRCVEAPKCEPLSLDDKVPSCKVPTTANGAWSVCEATAQEKKTVCESDNCNGVWDASVGKCMYARANAGVDVTVQVVSSSKLEGFIDFANWPVAFGDFPLVLANLRPVGSSGPGEAAYTKMPVQTTASLEKPEGKTRRLFTLGNLSLAPSTEYRLEITQERAGTTVGKGTRNFLVPKSSATVEYRNFPLRTDSLNSTERESVYNFISNTLTDSDFWRSVAVWAGAKADTSFLVEVDRKLRSVNPAADKLLLLPKSNTADLSVSEMNAYIFVKILWDPSNGIVPGFASAATQISGRKAPHVRLYVENLSSDLVDPPSYVEAYYVSTDATSKVSTFYGIVPLAQQRGLRIYSTYSFRMWAVAYAPALATAPKVPPFDYNWLQSDAKSAPFTVYFTVPAYTSDLCALYKDTSATKDNPLNYYLVNPGGQCVRPSAGDSSTVQRFGDLEVVRLQPNMYNDLASRSTKLVYPWRPIDIVVENTMNRAGTSPSTGVLWQRTVTIDYIGPTAVELENLKRAYDNALELDPSLASTRNFERIRTELTETFRWTSLAQLAKNPPIVNQKTMTTPQTQDFANDWNKYWIEYIKRCVSYLDENNLLLGKDNLMDRFYEGKSKALLVTKRVQNLAYDIEVNVPDIKKGTAFGNIVIKMYHTTDASGVTACPQKAPVLVPQLLPDGFDFSKCGRATMDPLCDISNPYIEQGLFCNIEMPRGVITYFFGTQVPLGWALCDGSRGTPDLRNRFVRGTQRLIDMSGVGGNSSIKLSEAHLPNHNHSISVYDAGAHSHSINSASDGSHNHGNIRSRGWRGGWDGANRGNRDNWVSTSTHPWHVHTNGTLNANGRHGHSFTLAYQGGNEDLSLLPNFTRLAFIMKL